MSQFIFVLFVIFSFAGEYITSFMITWLKQVNKLLVSLVRYILEKAVVEYKSPAQASLVFHLCAL